MKMERLARWLYSLATSLAITLSAGLVIAAHATPGTVTSCGSVISQDLVLKNDVGPCSGDGLTIGANAITVNLNGHRIYATKRTHVGVRLAGFSNVTVKGGFVEGFDTGVLLTGGQANQVSVMTIQGNRFGILVEDAEASNHQLTNNVITNNRLIGLFLAKAVSNSSVLRNQVNGNVGYGIVVAGGSSFNLLQANEAVGNGVRDIVLREYSFDSIITNLTPPVFTIVAPVPSTLTEGADFRVMYGEPSARPLPRVSVTGRLVPVGIALNAHATAISNDNPVDTSSSLCTPLGASGLQPGDILLVQRGTCTLDTKLLNAHGSIVIFNEGQQPDRVSSAFGSFADPFGGSGHPIDMVVMSLSYARGYELLKLASTGEVQVHLEAQAVRSPGPGTTPPAEHNTITKNTAGSAVDENYFCGTNLWGGNVFSSINRICVGGDYSGDGGFSGGLGASTNAY